ncbi:putative glycoside hydrolase [Cytobacillus suaedae]|nr:putative glycoside hydrolase [Cytobacillus suaedae]
MGKKTIVTVMFIVTFIFSIGTANVYATEKAELIASHHSGKEPGFIKKELPEKLTRFMFDSGFTFEYPDAIRGIYVTGHSAGGSKFEKLLNLVDNSDLNAMVIDIKDDHGNLTYKPKEASTYEDIAKNYIKDPVQVLKTLEEKQIYPIARVVVFKDSVLANKQPELSFKEGNAVWKNGRGESFVNPFLQEVWDYNVGIAIEAAKLGFQEIQFDYVRFPEGFEKRDKTLVYNMGEYQGDQSDVKKRVQAVTDFVAYAKEKLEPYNVKVSVDIFGYTATLPEAPGIGQNFSKISEHVDVISSMIYPSHWTSYFGIAKPDIEPYQLVTEYAKVEKEKLSELQNPPISRPWIQDFTARWLGKGNYKVYGKAEVEAQIRGLNEQGISEYLIWNAGNTYTEGVDYTPLN